MSPSTAWSADIHHISGGHGATTDGVLIAAGPDIAAGAVLDGIHVRDMTPTFLYGLDAPVARDFPGRPWRELFTDDFRARHQVQADRHLGNARARRGAAVGGRRDVARGAARARVSRLMT